MIAQQVARANKDHVSVEAGDFVVEELDEAGSGKLHFANSSEALVWRGGRTSPISWLAERKCADAIILSNKEDGSLLYLVELKNSVGIAELKKMRSQFLGAYLNFIALSAVVEALKPQRVELIVGLKRDKIEALAAANPSVTKLVGGPEAAYIAQWLTGSISIDGIGNFKVRKVVRDATTGNGAAQL